MMGSSHFQKQITNPKTFTQKIQPCNGTSMMHRLGHSHNPIPNKGSCSFTAAPLGTRSPPAPGPSAGATSLCSQLHSICVISVLFKSVGSINLYVQKFEIKKRKQFDLFSSVGVQQEHHSRWPTFLANCIIGKARQMSRPPPPTLSSSPLLT